MKIQQFVNGKLIRPGAPKHDRIWYEMNTGFVMPDGYYFVDEARHMRYGPFDTEADCIVGEASWKLGEEYP